MLLCCTCYVATVLAMTYVALLLSLVLFHKYIIILITTRDTRESRTSRGSDHQKLYSRTDHGRRRSPGGGRRLYSDELARARAHRVEKDTLETGGPPCADCHKLLYTSHDNSIRRALRPTVRTNTTTLASSCGQGLAVPNGRSIRLHRDGRGLLVDTHHRTELGGAAPRPRLERLGVQLVPKIWCH